MSFKLLAIRPLKGCEIKLFNNLQENQFYFFDDAYEPHGKLDFIKEKDKYQGLSRDFFYTKENGYETSLKAINIQAIVGKNGSGKSSIIEFLLRMLNNFFKKINKKNKTTEKLIYVEGLFGELYFKKEEILYKLLLDFRKNETDEKNPINEIYYIVRHEINGNPIDESINNVNLLKNKSTTNSEVTDEVSEFFFTMYVNYSLYGLDEDEFIDDGYNIEESKDLHGNKIECKVSWLNKIFHKNDGYQTPVVIHPYRESAMIDVRREKELMKQRLSALIFTNEEYRKIIPEYNFDEIRIKLKDDSALDYFLKNIHDIQKNYQYFSEIFKTNISDTVLNDKISSLSDWVDRNKKLLHHYNSLQNTSQGPGYDLQIYLYAIYAYLKKIEFEEFKKEGNEVTVYTYIKAFLGKEGFLTSHMNKVYEDPIFKKILDSTSHLSLSTLINLIQISISHNVCLKYFKYKEVEINFSLDRSTDKLKDYLFWYCVVKLVKSLKYNTHLNFNDLFNPTNIFNFTNEKLASFGKKYFADVLLIDKSHVTDKLRRTISLLKLMKKTAKTKGLIEKKENDLSTSHLINFYRNVINRKQYECHVSELGDLIISTKDLYGYKNFELTNFLPPAIFEFDFYSLSKSNKDKIPLSKISSGQFQKIGLLSSIVYHLKNLDSITVKEHIYDYKNILIILDEIELYFHPEQQRIFINDLITLLKANRFNKIENLNIFFITHSPFILSDIPSQNVLKLENGEMKRADEKNSFGANIHDLLADEFFLENGFMGEFAMRRINECIVLLNWKILYKEFSESIRNAVDEKLTEDIKKQIVELFTLHGTIENLEQDKSIKIINEFKDLTILWQSKVQIESKIPIKEYNIQNVDEFINGLKNEIFLFINNIGETLIKIKLLEMFNDSFKEESELLKLLKKREMIDKKIAKLGTK